MNLGTWSSRLGWVGRSDEEFGCKNTFSETQRSENRMASEIPLVGTCKEFVSPMMNIRMIVP
jgi:hypothetical protein